ncbi:erg24, C-14 sterol reductase [Basidiobolus ranarum]|uniref:Erg24, C-14 sterol reductase n=1 Tax=Basidiobolus ranarum TaxID=34480 RepID=A0ABR2WG05_9FUNG
MSTNLARRKPIVKKECEVSQKEGFYQFSSLNPKTTRFEFAGPWGATALLIAMPLLTLHFMFECDGIHSCSFFPETAHWSFKGIFDLEATIAYFGWVLYLVGLFYILPGKWVEGTTLRNGKKLEYKLNGNHMKRPVCWPNSLTFFTYNIR